MRSFVYFKIAVCIFVLIWISLGLFWLRYSKTSRADFQYGGWLYIFLKEVMIDSYQI